MSRRLIELGQIILLAAVYFTAAKLSLSLAIPPGYATAVWPPSGIALAAVLLFGTRLWPGVWLGAALTNLTVQGAPLLAAMIGTGNTLEAVIGAELVRRYAGSGRFDTMEQVVKFVGTCALCATIAAGIGVFSLALNNALSWSDFLANVWTWWEGDAAGMMLVTPLILSWRTSGWKQWSLPRTIEAVALIAALAIVTFVVFGDIFAKGTSVPIAFITLPFIIWPAIRFRQREVMTAATIVCMIAGAYTLKGYGPWGATPVNTALLILLAYTSTLVMIGLVLCAVIGERERGVAALRESNELLASRVAALQETERQMKEFLAMLSHELRNPLAAIVGARELMRRTSGSEWTKLSEVIDRQTAHLSRIVDDLLDVSRITRGRVDLDKKVLNLNGLVRDVLDACRPEIDARRHRVELMLARDILPVDADSTRLSQVVHNLVSNAVKYTPEGGRITVRVAQEGGDAVLRVRDTGKGIPADLLPKVFDLFVQGDRSLDRTEGGLGIGLTLVKRLVELHGGTIEAESGGPDRGSEFIVRLPLARDRERARESVKEVLETPPANRRRLLVVDDNRDVANMLAALLEVMGHEVRTANDGPNAIAVASQYEPDAVILDIGLPGMNGYEVARKFRSSPEFSRVTLIAFTGYGQDEDRDKAREAGFDFHLAKPAEAGELARIVDSLPERT